MPRVCRSCCTTPGVTITALGCNSTPQAGLAVTVTHSGSTVASGTTNGSGVFTCTLSASTTYAYSVVGTSPRYGTFSGFLTTNSSGVATVTPTIPAATGYTCAACCNFPLKKAWVYSSTNGGTGTGTWNTGPQWAITATEPAAILDGTIFCNSTSGNSQIRFAVNCTPSGTALIGSVGWWTGNEGAGFPYYNQPNDGCWPGGGPCYCSPFEASGNAPSTTSFACSPLMIQGVIPSVNNNTPPTVTPPGAGATFTLTEAP